MTAPNIVSVAQLILKMSLVGLIIWEILISISSYFQHYKFNQLQWQAGRTTIAHGTPSR